MTQPSITSTPTFRARLVRSEIRRAWLMIAVWGAALAIYILRRELSGAVMAVDALFYALTVLLIAAMGFEAVSVVLCRKWSRQSGTAPGWYSHVSAAVELAVVVAALVMMQVWSPRGQYAALSAPILLGIPLVTMMSILRLKPIVCLGAGFTGALAHWALVAYAIKASDIEVHQWPVLFSYGVWIALTAVGAAMIAVHARKAVIEGVQEALSAERTERALAVMERDLTVAQEIQAGLMPASSPTIAGYDIAGFARPAAKAGGDYYDWQPTADDRLVVAMADVTGHGIGPALVMAVCRSYARASTPEAPDPSALLSRINRLIYEDLSRTGRFITMAIAILDPDGTVQLASAGHGPTLVYRAATKEVEVFGGDGLPLGVMEGEEYGPHRTFRLDRGDVLLLLTDGFMEWHGGPERKIFGIDRLKDSLRNDASGNAKSVIEKLDAAVQAYAAGVEQEDDTTAVAIKRV